MQKLADSSTPIVGIDCRLAGLQHAGIGRYIENLLLHILIIDDSFHFVLFFSNKKQAKDVLKNKIHQKIFQNFSKCLRIKGV